jgi:hypothetical protein
MSKRIYNFAVYITAEEQTDNDGYSQAEIERLLQTTLNYYSAPLNKERGSVSVDFELMSSEEVK